MRDSVAHEDVGNTGEISIDVVTTASGTFDVKTGASMRFDAHITSAAAYSGNLVMEIFSQGGVLVSRTDRMGSPVNLRPGANVVSIEIPNLPLLDGVFDINLGVVDERGSNVIAWSEKIASMQVSYGGREGGLVELGTLIRQL